MAVFTSLRGWLAGQGQAVVIGSGVSVTEVFLKKIHEAELKWTTSEDAEFCNKWKGVSTEWKETDKD